MLVFVLMLIVCVSFCAFFVVGDWWQVSLCLSVLEFIMPEICQDLEPQNSLRLHSGQLSFALDVHFPCDTRNGACWLILLLGFRSLFFLFIVIVSCIEVDKSVLSSQWANLPVRSGFRSSF